MITIEVSEIKEFFKRSKGVKPNTSNPITSYIKLEANENCTLLKTNLNSYCVHEVKADYPSSFVCLVDERLLAKVLEQGTDDVVEIKVEPGRVILTCGIAQVRDSFTDPSLFPTFPEISEQKEGKVLTKDVLEAVGIAAQTLVVDRDCQLSYVHVNGAVFSSDNFSLYLKKLSDSFPDLVLDRECCLVISEYDSLQYFTAGNYHFFDTGKTMYGFIKTEYKTPAYHVIFKKSEGEPFEINKEDFISFCELTSVSPAKVPIASFDSKDGKILFSFNDPEFGKGAEMEFEMSGEIKEPFNFNPRLILPFIKSLPYKKLLFAPLPGYKYSVTTKEDETFSGIICGHSN
jgi:DNA polymerase III sliding clamp (beta) subunit (PCNA family)